MVYESENGDILMAITGDSMITRSHSKFREERFLEMVQMLRDADISYTDAAGSFRLRDEGYPNEMSGGNAGATYYSIHPSIIKELLWLGIDVVSCANNHAFDYGPEGVLSTIKHMDEAGMYHAGSGHDLKEARAPVYIDTPKGRAAVIGVCDSPNEVHGVWGMFGAGNFSWALAARTMAGERTSYSNGRPGLNLLRHRVTFTIPQEEFEHLRHLQQKLGLEPTKKPGRGLLRIDEDTDTLIHFLGTKFYLGDDFAFSAVAYEKDVEGNLKWVREARRQADWVIVGFHNHGMFGLPGPSEYATSFARACIDAGADVIDCHGPHATRPIEIYKGRPIFYSLGSLFFEVETYEWPPYDLMTQLGLGLENTPSDYYDAVNLPPLGSTERPTGQGIAQGVIAMVSFKRKELKEIRLYPLNLGMHLTRGQKGRPMLAEPGSEISNFNLKRLQEISAPYGTKIEIEDGVGVIRL